MKRNELVTVMVGGLLAVSGCGGNSSAGGGSGGGDGTHTPAGHVAQDSAALFQQMGTQLRWGTLVHKDAGLGALTGDLLRNQVAAVVSTLPGVGAIGGVARAAAAANPAGAAQRMRQGLQAAPSEHTDLDCQPGTGVCTVTVTKTAPEAGVAMDIVVLVVDTKSTADRTDDVLLALHGTKTYVDGSTGAYVATDTDGDNNLQTGAVILTEHRVWPDGAPSAEGKVVSDSKLTLVVGNLDNPADDVLLAIEGADTFADGHTGAWSATDLDGETDPGYSDIRAGRAQARFHGEWPDGAPQAEGLAAETLLIGVLQNSPATDQDDEWFSFHAEKHFRDGSLSIVDLSEADTPADGSLSTGIVRYHENRTWDAGAASMDGLVSAEAEYVVQVNGPGEADDATVSGHVHVVHQDGTDTTVDIAPETPIPHGADLDTGTVTTTTVFPESAETVRAQQKVTATRDAAGHKTVRIESTTEYRNGLTGTETSTVTITEDGRGEISGTRRDGVAYAGAFDQGAGSWHVTYTFAAGGEIASITEEGQWQEMPAGSGDGTGSFKRTVRWSDGRADSVTASTVTKSGADTHIEATEPDGGHGTVTLHEERFFTDVNAQWTSPQGFHSTWHGRRFLSGQATLDATWDDPVTTPDPDVEASFFFNPDGTGQGTVTTHHADGTTSTARVRVTPDGSGSAVDDGTGAEDVF